jgi:oxysterol-binding protein-related protein 9/10/11
MIVLTNFFGRMGNLSALKDFISFLATVKGDLSNITAPPFILSPQSLTEFPAYWAERPSLFASLANEPSPERRMLAVLQIYLTSLQRQYYIGKPVSEGTKKPLNPFLGELFLCSCTDPSTDNTIEVICEQVSHHPPTTACLIRDTKTGIRAQAYSTQHTSLSGTSVVVRQSGHAILTIPAKDNTSKPESYLLPFPDVYAKNVITGSPYPELHGVYHLFSTTGYTAELNFGASKSKNPFSSAERNSFEATISKSVNSSDNTPPTFKLTGIWSSKWTIASASDSTETTYDLNAAENAPLPLTLPALQDQSPWESRRAWGDVAEPLAQGDFSAALNAKSKLENAQRELRKKEKDSGRKWEAAFFSSIEEGADAELARLLEQARGVISKEDVLGRHGVWRFDAARERAWREGRVNWPATPLG